MLASASATGVSISAASRCAAAATARAKELRSTQIKIRLRIETMGEIASFGAMAKWMMVLCMVAAVHQVSAGCKHCSQTVGKEDKAMFRTHSDACLATSKADPSQVDALYRGEFVDTPQLKNHVYCVLMKCKVVGKDGKLQKTTVLDRAGRGNGKDIAKILENCAEHQYGDTPEDLTWNLFRCAYDKKAILFDYMPYAASTL